MRLVRLCTAVLVLGLPSLSLAQKAALRPGVPAPLLEGEHSRRVDFVWFSGTPGKENVRGGTEGATVTVKPNPSGDIRVAVFEEFSGGAGDQWRASVWMASFLASSTLGRTLTDYEFGVSTGGFVDGPSAGGLTTAAMMATMLGVAVDPTVTLTGTLNPDGSIGPVGGLPQKLRGAAAKGKRRFGFPVGQRYDVDLRSLEYVDLVAEAGARNMEAREVRDVHDAFQLLTGKVLLRPVPLEASAMELPGPVFTRMEQTTLLWMREARERLATMRQEQTVPALTQPMVRDAQSRLQAALRYQLQGMGAMAYRQALTAAVSADIAVQTERFVELAMDEDPTRMRQEVESLLKGATKVEKVFVELSRREPRTASGALTLLSAYSAATVAWAFAELGLEDVEEFNAIVKGPRKGEVTAEWRSTLRQAVASKLIPALMHFLAAEYALQLVSDALVAGTEEGAPLHLEEAALQRLARTYTSAAKANLDYYDSLMLSGVAEERGMSLAAARQVKTTEDEDYRFARKLMELALRQRKAPGSSGAMTTLAASLGAWLRGSSLVAREYSLGVIQEGGVVKGVKKDKAFSAMLELAELKAREQAALAREVTGVVPVTAQLGYLEAQARREGSPEDKLEALSCFWHSSAVSQLAVLMSRTAFLPTASATAP
jgi:hypothetical protein